VGAGHAREQKIVLSDDFLVAELQFEMLWNQ
jgi:hypothetical protein